jgi:hypothetical protein
MQCKMMESLGYPVKPVYLYFYINAASINDILTAYPYNTCDPISVVRCESQTTIEWEHFILRCFKVPQNLKYLPRAIRGWGVTIEPELYDMLTNADIGEVFWPMVRHTPNGVQRA